MSVMPRANRSRASLLAGLLAELAVPDTEALIGGVGRLRRGEVDLDAERAEVVDVLVEPLLHGRSRNLPTATGAILPLPPLTLMSAS
jgi:hypothetical protein